MVISTILCTVCTMFEKKIYLLTTSKNKMSENKMTVMTIWNHSIIKQGFYFESLCVNCLPEVVINGDCNGLVRAAYESGSSMALGCDLGRHQSHLTDP